LKNKILVITFFLFSSTFTFCQEISSTDSLKVVEAYKRLFRAIEVNDKESLINMATDKIYCMICSQDPDFLDSPYMFSKIDFITHHLEKIKKSEFFQRIVKNEKLILVKENDYRTDVTAFWTIYEKDELAKGYEGMQLGIYFKKVKSEFKFSGIEIIP